MAWLKSSSASRSASSGEGDPLPSFDFTPTTTKGVDVDLELEDEKSGTVEQTKLAPGSVPPPRIGELPPPPLASTMPPRRPGDQATSTPASERKPSLLRAGRTLAWATRLENAALGRLSPAMRVRVGEHRTAVLAGAGGVTLLLLLALGFGARAAFGSSPAQERSASTPSTDEAPTAAVAPTAPVAPAATMDSAKATPVSKQDEASVLLDLAESLLKQRRDSEVPALLARLIARRPELKDDDRLQHALLVTASSFDMRAANDSFTLLTGPMAEPGAALVYELSQKTDVRDVVRARAQRWLASSDFQRVSALQVYAAVKLRNAKTCEDKRGLLDFAGQAGGKYVLSYLKELESKTSCGPDDLEHCYPCMRNDSHLSETIAKLDKH